MSAGNQGNQDNKEITKTFQKNTIKSIIQSKFDNRNYANIIMAERNHMLLTKTMKQINLFHFETFL